MIVQDHDLAAFVQYAKRELQIDESERVGSKFGLSPERRHTIAALRVLSLRILLNNTRQARMIDPNHMGCE